MKKKVLAFLLAAVTVASCVVPALGVTRSEWQGMKDIADGVMHNFTTGYGYTVAKALAAKYGYQVVEAFEFPRVWETEEGNVSDTGLLYSACDHLVTKEQVITVLKEMYPLLSDELAEKMIDSFGGWYKWCAPAADGTYAVGNIPMGGGANYYFAGYTQEDDVFHFYYGCPELGEGPNVASIEYGGKTYYADGYDYVTGEAGNIEYADEIEYQGKTYKRTWSDGYVRYTKKASYEYITRSEREATFGMIERANRIEYQGKTYVNTAALWTQPAEKGYFAEVEAPMPEIGTEDYEARLSSWWWGSIGDQENAYITVNEVNYYRKDNGYFALNLPETEAEQEALFARATLLSEPTISIAHDSFQYYEGSYYFGGTAPDPFWQLTSPVIRVGDDCYFYHNGSYYALPDAVWGEQLTYITEGNTKYYYSVTRGWFYKGVPGETTEVDYNDKLELPTVESNGKTYTLEYSDWDYEEEWDYDDKLPFLTTIESGGKTYTLRYHARFTAEDGEELGQVMPWGAEIVLNGVTYYMDWMELRTLPGFGNEIVLKLENGKVSLVSYSGGYSEEEGAVSFPTDMLSHPADDGATYAVKAGTPAAWAKDSGKDLVVTSEADFAKFVAVKVDGEIVDPIHYTVESGSTKVTFKESYLKTLSNGTHTFTIVSTDGEASTTLSIQGAAATAPNTGDNSCVALWFTAGVLALAGAVTLLCRRKRI